MLKIVMKSRILLILNLIQSVKIMANQKMLNRRLWKTTIQKLKLKIL